MWSKTLGVSNRANLGTNEPNKPQRCQNFNSEPVHIQTLIIDKYERDYFKGDCGLFRLESVGQYWHSPVSSLDWAIYFSYSSFRINGPIIRKKVMVAKKGISTNISLSIPRTIPRIRHRIVKKRKNSTVRRRSMNSFSTNLRSVHHSQSILLIPFIRHRPLY